MHSKLYFGLAVSWTIIITFLCLVSSDSIPGVNVPNADKFVHGSLYFLFTIFWYLFFRGNLSELEISRVLLFVFLVAGLYGVMIELAQAFFTTTRTADINDVFANLSGSLIAALLLYIQGKFRERHATTK